MDILLITDKNKAHYLYINNFSRFMCNKEKKKKNKKHFYSVLVMKKVFEENGKVCLKINIKQSVKIRSGPVKFKNYLKQLAVSFKVYADFESILKGIKSNDRNNNVSYTEKYQNHIPCSFAYKVVCIDDKFSKPVFLYKGKNVVNKFIKAIPKEHDYCKKIIKKHFNKNIVMFEED